MVMCIKGPCHWLGWVGGFLQCSTQSKWSVMEFHTQWRARDIIVSSKWILYNKAPFTTLVMPLSPHILRKFVTVSMTAPLLSRELEIKLLKLGWLFIVPTSHFFLIIHQISNLLDSIIKTPLIWAGDRSDRASASLSFIGTFFELTAARKATRYKSNSTCRWKTCGCTLLPATLLLFSDGNLINHTKLQSSRQSD